MSVRQPRVEQSEGFLTMIREDPGLLGDLVMETVPGPEACVMEDPGLQQVVTARGEAVQGQAIMRVHQGGSAPIDVTPSVGQLL